MHFDYSSPSPPPLFWDSIFPPTNKFAAGGRSPTRTFFETYRKYFEFITQKDAFLRLFHRFLCNFPSFSFPFFIFSPISYFFYFLPQRPSPSPTIVFCIIYIPELFSSRFRLFTGATLKYYVIYIYIYFFFNI